MYKLIQTIALTAVIFSPLSLISLVTSANAHHTHSHVSTVAKNTIKTRQAPIKKNKKSAVNVARKQKSAVINAN
jgi:ABC-type transporter MlaC component